MKVSNTYARSIPEIERNSIEQQPANQSDTAAALTGWAQIRIPIGLCK
jgi:hypothetical protein